MLNRRVIRALKKLNAIIIMSFVLFMGLGTSVLYAETATAIDQEEALVLKKIIQPDQQANTNQNTSQGNTDQATANQSATSPVTVNCWENRTIRYRFVRS